MQENFHRQEAEAAGRKGDLDRARLQRDVADSALANVTRASERQRQLEPIHETRNAWERIAEPTLRLAQASDAELHRRGILGEDDKLKSAEPEGIGYPEPSDEQKAKDERQPPIRAETEHRQMAALGLTKDGDGDPYVSAQLAEAAAYVRQQQARIDELLSLRVPAEGEEELDLGRAWGTIADQERAAILQPPKPEIKSAQPSWKPRTSATWNPESDEMSAPGHIMDKTPHAEGWRHAMTIQDVYLLTVHDPYEAPEHPAPINGTIVHARTLLHPGVPQPDGGRMYRCLTECPVRTDGAIVPLSTLTFELDGGQLWPDIADWEAVSDAVVRLSRGRHCDAMPLGLTQRMVVALANGPATVMDVYVPGRGKSVLTPRDREQYLETLSGHLRNFVATGPFWPGNDLVEPPADPKTIPFKPHGSWRQDQDVAAIYGAAGLCPVG